MGFCCSQQASTKIIDNKHNMYTIKIYKEGFKMISRKLNIKYLTVDSLAKLLAERDDEEFNRLEVDHDGKVYIRYGKEPFGPTDYNLVAIVWPSFCPGQGYCGAENNTDVSEDLFLLDAVYELKHRWGTKLFGYVG